jgi:hypothetical protein
MASQFPVDDNDPTLLALEQAFHDVWTVLAAHEPYRDRTEDHERRMELSRTLMVLAANGVTDLAELRRLGFRSLLLPQAIRHHHLTGSSKGGSFSCGSGGS